jgi:cytosine deaminase
LVKDGKIVRISDDLVPSGEDTIDAAGAMAIPPYVDSHCHLDYVATYGDPEYNMTGTLFDGIRIWGERKKKITKDDVKKRAEKVLRWEIAHGTQFVRTHVNSDEPGLVSTEAMLEVKAEMRELIDIQIIAFPQHGLLNYQEGFTLLEEAAKMGVDGLGAIPHYEDTREDSVTSLIQMFDLAEKYDKLVDVHCDETDDEHSRAVEVVANQAWKRGLGSRVTASHTTAMGSYNNAYAYKLMSLLQRSEINFVTNPTINIHLQGRYDTYPKRRGITRVRELLEAGCNVSMGCDDIMDPFYPMGAGNMLDVLNMGVHVCHLTGYNQLISAVDMITVNGAKTLSKMDVYGLEEGKPANFNIIPAGNDYDLIRRLVKPLYCIRGGQIIVKRNQDIPSVWNGSEYESEDCRV